MLHGHLADFILNDESWVMLYVIIDTRNWLPGKKVLVSTAWISGIDWEKSSVAVDLMKSVIEKGPLYDPTRPVNREYEIRLYDYYGRPKYWM